MMCTCKEPRAHTYKYFYTHAGGHKLSRAPQLNYMMINDYSILPIPVTLRSIFDFNENKSNLKKNWLDLIAQFSMKPIYILQRNRIVRIQLKHNNQMSKKLQLNTPVAAQQHTAITTTLISFKFVFAQMFLFKISLRSVYGNKYF